jgi:hypothetical protein
MSTLIDSEPSTDVSQIVTSFNLVNWFTIKDNKVVGHRGIKSKLENLLKYSKETIFLDEEEANRSIGN